LACGFFGRELARVAYRDGERRRDGGVFGGLLGAKLLWIAEHIGEERFEICFSAAAA
jgi:hypothetical protein